MHRCDILSIRSALRLLLSTRSIRSIRLLLSFRINRFSQAPVSASDTVFNPVYVPDPIPDNRTPYTPVSIWSPVSPIRIPVSDPIPIPPRAPPQGPVPVSEPSDVPVYPPRRIPFVIAPDGSSLPLPHAPDVEQDVHYRSFESEIDPPNTPKWSEYRRMLEFFSGNSLSLKERNLLSGNLGRNLKSFFQGWMMARTRFLLLIF